MKKKTFINHILVIHIKSKNKFTSGVVTRKLSPSLEQLQDSGGQQYQVGPGLLILSMGLVTNEVFVF